jgi:hypothetical protein
VKSSAVSGYSGASFAAIRRVSSSWIENTDILPRIDRRPDRIPGVYLETDLDS